MAEGKKKLKELELKNLKVAQDYQSRIQEFEIKIKESNTKVEIDLIREEARLKKELNEVMDHRFYRLHNTIDALKGSQKTLYVESIGEAWDMVDGLVSKV